MKATDKPTQMTLDDADSFTPPGEWDFSTKTPRTLEYAACARCGKTPDTLDPLPKGWAWDTMEPTNPWLWCPHWHLPLGCKDPAVQQENGLGQNQAPA